MKIKWTDEAEDNLQENVSYLLSVWGLESAKDFLDELENKIEIIIKNPQIGNYDETWKCDKFLIVKQITLYYYFQNDILFIVDVWNNKKEPL